MSRAEDCWLDIMAKVKTVPEFVEKCVSVLSEEDLLTLLKGAKFPYAGVMYNGISNTGPGGDPSRQGLAADLACTVIIIVMGNAIGSLDQKNEAARLLDATRDAIKTTKSPTGHKWRYQREAPAMSIGNAVVYKQVWATAIILT